MDTEPNNEELRAFIGALLSNVDSVIREPEVLDEAIREHRDMWVMLYRCSVDADAIDPQS